MPKVRQHSRILDELPAEIRVEINRLLLEPGITYDDIYAHIKELGHDISRSSIGRYGKGFLAVYQKLRIIEDKSKALVNEVGEGLVLEEAASKMFVQKIIELQLEDKIDPTAIPRILSDFAKLQASSIMRERLKGDFKKKVDKVTEKVSKNKKLDPETIRIIKEEIYGIL